MEAQAEKARVDTSWEGDAMVVRFIGRWKMDEGIPDFDDITDPSDLHHDLKRIAVDVDGVEEWDSALLATIVTGFDWARAHHLEYDISRLPTTIRRLVDLSQSVPETEGTESHTARFSLINRVGQRTIDCYQGGVDVARFSGECSLSFLRFITGRVRFRWGDFFVIVQECSAEALPIVSLISFLVGLILAFVGAVQLKQFGAEIYVADLVGLAMVREMGCMMTAVIMAGRTGAAFAAQLGSMKVSEEIDALQTLGISPIDFLVLPRMMALFLIMPLLTVYSNIIGIVGGLVVATSLLDLSFVMYVNETSIAVGLHDIATGLIKSMVFGLLVAVSGCLRGMQSGNSADAVGLATTSAVVTGITLIIFFDAVFAIIFEIFEI